MSVLPVSSGLVRPYHPDGFVGVLEADGQQVKVAAIACDDDRVVLLSLVGYDTSIGVMFGRLWGATPVSFRAAAAWQNEWCGLEQVRRADGHYHTIGGRLVGVREVHALAALRTVSIHEGLLNPPDLPESVKSVADATDSASREPPASSSTPPPWVARYLVANGGDLAPDRRAFQGHLAALRVPLLFRHEDHPDWPDTWADALWDRGLDAHLLAPIQALGIRAWRMSGDILAWANLVGEGCRAGWLPWHD